MNTPVDVSRVALWRRLASAAYDSCVVAGIWFITAAVMVPLSGGAITSDRPGLHALFQLTLLTVGFAFFAFFWTRNGQTLGMLAWRVKVVRSRDGARITWSQALLRYLGALLSWLVGGLGFWWSLWDVEGKTWHDRISGTELRPAASFTEISNRTD